MNQLWLSGGGKSIQLLTRTNLELALGAALNQQWHRFGQKGVI